MAALLTTVSDLVDRSHRVWAFLNDRHIFCQQKVEQSRAERTKLASLGIQGPPTATGMEEQMAVMMHQDRQLMDRVVADVGVLLHSLAKKLDSAVCAAPSSGYAEFLRALHLKRQEGRLAFDISMLPNVVEPNAAAHSVPVGRKAAVGEAREFKRSAPPGFSTPSPITEAFHSLQSQISPEPAPRRVDHAPVVTTSVPVAAPAPAAAVALAAPAASAAPSATGAESPAPGPSGRRGPMRRNVQPGLQVGARRRGRHGLPRSCCAQAAFEVGLPPRAEPARAVPAAAAPPAVSVGSSVAVSVSPMPAASPVNANAATRGPRPRVAMPSPQQRPHKGWDKPPASPSTVPHVNLDEFPQVAARQ